MIPRSTRIDEPPIATVEDVSRRGLLTVTVAAAVFAACGDDKAAAPTTEATTRRVDTVKGPVDIPIGPRQVVCLDFVSTATLLDLGLTPAGMTRGGVDFLPEYDERFRAVPDIRAADGPNIELIAGLKPDLILGSDWEDPSKQTVPYDRLRAIAPTALFVWQQAAGNWMEQAAGYSDAVGLGDKLATLRGQFATRAESIKTTYASALARYRWDLVTGGRGEYYIYSPASSHGRVLAAAGVRLAAGGAVPAAGFETLSHEQIGRLAETDVIAVDTRGNVAATTRDLLDQPLFKGLKSAQSGRVYPLSWFFPSSYKTALALLDGVEAILKQLQ